MRKTTKKCMEILVIQIGKYYNTAITEDYKRIFVYFFGAGALIRCSDSKSKCSADWRQHEGKSGMKAKKFLEELLKQYAGTFDIQKPYRMGKERFDAYGYFFSRTEKYILIQEAQMWAANSFEHVLFQSFEQEITEEQLDVYFRLMREQMEPVLVRKGEPCTEKNHMYSYLTLILISEAPIGNAAIRKIRRFHFEKLYRFNFRGYSRGRIAAVDLAQQKVYTNGAGRELRRFYKSFLKDRFH